MNTYERTVLKVAHFEESTQLLGPYDRFVLWVHGCCFDCPGCLADNAKFGAYDEMDIESISKKILLSGCEGITVSGGEPFMQSAALSELIRITRLRKNIGVIVYSGYTLDEIKNTPEFLPLLSEIDILIDGRYKKELDDGRAYVGSRNQQIHYLTPRYIEAGQAYYSQIGRRAEIKFTPNQVVLVGVPSNEVLNVWKSIRAKSGNTGDAKHDF